jgi:predicted dienelactone hydrolase
MSQTGRGSACIVLLTLTLVTAGCGSDGNDIRATRPAISRNLSTVMERVANLPDYNIYRPADLGATGAPLPVIVWANGGCVRFDGAWESLLTSWARAGFVVVAIATPTGVDPRTAGMSTADDQARAIDWAYAESDLAGSPFAGHLDLTRVVAAGNSCGGITSLTLAARDERVRSVFVLSGSSVLPGASREAADEVMGNIDVPVGYVVGGPEDIATGPVRQDFDLVPEGVPAYVAHRFEGTHVEVSTDAGVLLEVAEISTNWIDFSLYRNPLVAQSLLEDPCGSCAPGTWTVEAKDLE